MVERVPSNKPLKRDEGEDDRSTTAIFVRVTYWCGDKRMGPFLIETHRLAPGQRADLEEMFRSVDHPVPHLSDYSRVHGVIGAAETILAYAPSLLSTLVEERETRAGGLCSDENSIRLDTDPVDAWDHP